MSVQSESGRIDYDKSDHAPKGQRMAGTVTRIPSSYNVGSSPQDSNAKSVKEPLKIDNTNVVPEVMLDMARKNKK